MLAIYLSPIYILLNLYIIRWLIWWMSACSRHFKKKWVRAAVVVTYSFFALSLVIGFLLPVGKPQRFMKLIGNYWLGVLLYVILTVIIADMIRVILLRIPRVDKRKLRSRRTFVITGTFCIVLITAVSLWGAANARIVRTTRYDVTVDKSAGDLKSLNIVLAADLHLGYNIGCRQMERMVRKINAENPDLVVFAGDIFDNEYEALDDPDRLISILKGIKSRYGVYACYGNHDIEEKILAGFTFHKKGDKKVSDIRMDGFLEKAGIQLLMDEEVLIDDSFYLYGRPDLAKPGRGIAVRKTPEEITENMDHSKPIIVMDHEPKELQELADAGVDLDLCGHTHDGQMFPGNLTIELMWENACGYLQKGKMHNIVTSGVGLFGPNMRVGTIAEVCQITVHFNGN
ncbi:metallophosphoesterase [Ruminococcus sp. OA3]|uniref:metallophosphoesterase n=1 Tax=Ruminococcus sp. OA3 TaxID=2914164 RepID=UPI001F057F33|nr:metallophosphoesterase [Ruminococcus sp. OA3]MCH1982013.1 metallophosphoesterase [Ruminococcus sp. OA3]